MFQIFAARFYFFFLCLKIELFLKYFENNLQKEKKSPILQWFETVKILWEERKLKDEVRRKPIFSSLTQNFKETKNIYLSMGRPSRSSNESTNKTWKEKTSQNESLIVWQEHFFWREFRGRKKNKQKTNSDAKDKLLQKETQKKNKLLKCLKLQKFLNVKTFDLMRRIFPLWKI